MQPPTNENIEDEQEVQEDIPQDIEEPDNDNKDQFQGQSNNKSSDEDIMNKLDEEAEKLDSHINNENLKIFSKYENYNEEELRAEISSKNESLIKLNDEKEESKHQLNSLIKKLNELISSNADILYHKEPDPILIKQLERIVSIRQRDLEMAKKNQSNF